MTSLIIPSSRALRGHALCGITILILGTLLLVACGDSDKAQKELEGSRLDVLNKVRHLRTLNDSNVDAGDLITGSYKVCKRDSVNYVARADWVKSASAKKNTRIVSVLAAVLEKDGWSIRDGESLEHSVLDKKDFRAELIEYPSRSIVRLYVTGKCFKVNDSADSFARRPADEYSK